MASASRQHTVGTPEGVTSEQNNTYPLQTERHSLLYGVMRLLRPNLEIILFGAEFYGFINTHTVCT